MEHPSHSLKKVCNELNIPTPDSGYWTKIRMGKSVKIKPLPNSEKEPFSLIPGSDKQIELHEKLPEGYKPITVSTQLRSLHPLVEKEKTQKVKYENIRMETELKRKKAANIAEKKRQIKENREPKFQEELK